MQGCKGEKSPFLAASPAEENCEETILEVIFIIVRGV